MCTNGNEYVTMYALSSVTSVLEHASKWIPSVAVGCSDFSGIICNQPSHISSLRKSPSCDLSVRTSYTERQPISSRQNYSLPPLLHIHNFKTKKLLFPWKELIFFLTCLPPVGNFIQKFLCSQYTITALMNSSIKIIRQN